MSEYEMISAAQGYIAQGNVAIMNAFTVLAAYLAAGYLMAGRINLFMALFLTSLFVLFEANSILAMYTVGNILQALLIHMHEAAAMGKDLKWAPVAQQPPNICIQGGAAIAVMVLAVVGAIAFFFMARARQLKSGI